MVDSEGVLLIISANVIKERADCGLGCCLNPSASVDDPPCTYLFHYIPQQMLV